MWCVEKTYIDNSISKRRSSSRNILIPTIVGFLFVGLPAPTANAQGADPVRITNDAVNSAVQAAIQSARDRAYERERGGQSGKNPSGANFLGGPSESAKSYLRGAATEAPGGAQVGVWSSGSYTREEVSGSFNGVDLGSTSRTWAALTGIDVTSIRPVNGVTVVFGLLGGWTDTTIRTDAGFKSSTEAGTGGGYAAFLLGQFSTDVSFTITEASSSGIDTISRSLSNNVQYRFNLGGTSYFEPTAGIVWTESSNPLIDDTTTLRVQGGGRIGKSWGNVAASLTGLLYSDVYMSGPPVPIEDQIWGKLTAKFDYTFTSKFSAYVQGDVYGTNGDEDHIGWTATIGGRLAF